MDDSVDALFVGSVVLADFCSRRRVMALAVLVETDVAVSGVQADASGGCGSSFIDFGRGNHINSGRGRDGINFRFGRAASIFGCDSGCLNFRHGSGCINLQERQRLHQER